MKESFYKAQVSLKDYLSVIFHRRRFFLLPASIVFFTAAIGSFFLPKYYSSSVLVLVEEEQKAINPLASRPTYVPTATPTLIEQLKTLTEKILNYPQLRMVVRELGLDVLVKDPLEMEKLINNIRRRITVRLRSPEVFEVSYEDRDPSMAEKVVNTLVDSFINYNIEKKRKMALVGVNFAESQIEVYREKLRESEKKLYEFRKEFPLQSPGKDTDINVSLLVNYQTQLTATQLALQDNEKERMFINDQLNGQETVMMTDELLESNPIIGSLNDKLKAAQIQLDDLMQNDPSSSLILDLQIRIDDLRRRLSEETEKFIDGQTPQTAPVLFQQLEQQKLNSENRITTLRLREAELIKLVHEYESRIESLPEQDRILADLLRGNRVNNNIYEMLRLKVEENRLDAIELEQRGIRYEILEKGRVPLKSSKPQKLLISVIALILGVLSGLGCVFLVEASDHSFKNIEDARKFLQVPVIGSTMKIVTQYELRVFKSKQRRFTIMLTLVFVLFIVIAVVSSFIQEKKLTEQILKEQMMRD